MRWRDASGVSHSSPTVTLLAANPAPTTIDVIAGTASSPSFAPANRAVALMWGGSAAASTVAASLYLAQPVLKTAPFLSPRLSGFFAQAPAAAPRAGFVTVSLVEDLLHADFARDAARAATPATLPLSGSNTFKPQVLNPPYTPKVQDITLDYAAESDESRIDDPSQAAFTDTGVQFFQIDALGLAREQAWLGSSRPWAPQGGISLLPAHPAAAEFLIGLEGARPGDSVSLLFQVAEGTADPLASRRPCNGRCWPTTHGARSAPAS